ncbi:LuxR family transcriptional regulator [Kribbella sp. NPDC049584]|uniref:helix-turn-helix domain-containing protein n=1 Tax=Kribbella sp. NPDC049584 TaxID=3154833 RepID=UPI003438A661
MSTERPGNTLRGRRAESGVLDRLLGDVRSGRSQVIVVRGEPGVGKSALLGHALRSASGCRVVQAVGIEYEMELAYAGLHQLCAPLLPLRDRLPGPHRDALETAFGLSAKSPPDRFVVGLAVLGLLSEAAEEQPLVCLIDDVQWLDQASLRTITFVARRLLAESVGLLARDGLSNPEIGAELYISRHTVEWHMRKVFAKLDITSRKQLGHLPVSRLASA